MHCVQNCKISTLKYDTSGTSEIVHIINWAFGNLSFCHNRINNRLRLNWSVCVNGQGNTLFFQTGPGFAFEIKELWRKKALSWITLLIWWCYLDEINYSLNRVDIYGFFSSHKINFVSCCVDLYALFFFIICYQVSPWENFVNDQRQMF